MFLDGALDTLRREKADWEVVDLLCKGKRVAVEIDGAFHFEDAEHYRRDRRKDFLLQKNGYLVLRFLAEDVTTRLAQVVDRDFRRSRLQAGSLRGGVNGNAAMKASCFWYNMRIKGNG